MTGTSKKCVDMSERRWLDLNARKDDKIDLLRAENHALKKEIDALRFELNKTRDELQCLQEALTILPAEE